MADPNFNHVIVYGGMAAFSTTVGFQKLLLHTRVLSALFVATHFPYCTKHGMKSNALYAPIVVLIALIRHQMLTLFRFTFKYIFI